MTSIYSLSVIRSDAWHGTRLAHFLTWWAIRWVLLNAPSSIAGAPSKFFKWQFCPWQFSLYFGTGLRFLLCLKLCFFHFGPVAVVGGCFCLFNCTFYAYDVEMLH